MTTYPGQRSRRGAVATALAVIVALGAGVAIGWAVFHSDSHATNAVATPCPGGEHDPRERARAGACLLDAYMALGSQPVAARDSELAGIVLPSKINGFRHDYRAVGSEYPSGTTVYASVAAVKLDQNPADSQAPDVGYQVWVPVAVNTTPPRSAWYLGTFAIRWQSGRWWLTSGFTYNSTVPTYAMPEASTQFGSGWIEI